MTDPDEKIGLQSAQPDLIPQVIAFLQSRTYFEKERLLRQHPELLSKETDHILKQIEDYWSGVGNDERAQGISTWREFLCRVKDTDFELAMLERITLHAVVGIINQQVYMSGITNDYPELLADRADEAMTTVMRKLGQDNRLSQLVDAIRVAAAEQKVRKDPVRREAMKKLEELRHKPWNVAQLFV